MRRYVLPPLSMIIFIALSGTAFGATTVYKCKNQQGELIYQKSPCLNTTETVTSWTPVDKIKPPIQNQDQGEKQPPQVLKLKQDSRGHYTAEGSINNMSLNFVVDTGATIVSLPEAVAHSAQIYCDKPIDMNTANGVASACTAKVTKFQFGPFLMKDVPAVISPNLSQPLLGMNVLQAFKIAQENGEMLISAMENEKPKP
jgi:clan AA aspartic protease (TIGR02281 family)